MMWTDSRKRSVSISHLPSLHSQLSEPPSPEGTRWTGGGARVVAESPTRIVVASDTSAWTDPVAPNGRQHHSRSGTDHSGTDELETHSAASYRRRTTAN